MSHSLGLIELLLVFSAGLVWGLFELRSLRASKKNNPKAPPPHEPPSPPV